MATHLNIISLSMVISKLHLFILISIKLMFLAYINIWIDFRECGWNIYYHNKIKWNNIPTRDVHTKDPQKYIFFIWWIDLSYLMWLPTLSKILWLTYLLTEALNSVNHGKRCGKLRIGQGMFHFHKNPPSR